ncbi:MAG: diguanylate cyclase [bacterium]
MKDDSDVANGCWSTASPEPNDGGPDLDYTAEVARKAIPTMARFRIPLTPDNYRVWFEYLTGSHEELSREIDQLLNSGHPFTPARNRELFSKYFDGFEERKILERLMEETYRILRESLDKVASTGDATEAYSARLRHFLARFGEEKEGAVRLKEMIGELVLETRSMIEASSELKDQLDRAEREAESLRKELKTVQREATRDVLTGLYNRKHIEGELRSLYAGFCTDRVPFSVIMIDIDHFKKINDTFGHRIGDAVLEFIGAALKGAVKGRDVPGRYGGEEFVVLLPMTTCENACRLAENLRAEISTKCFKVARTQRQIGMVTISAGVAEIRGQDDPESVVARADRALYLAKEMGRNRVRSERDLPEARAETGFRPPSG